MKLFVRVSAILFSLSVLQAQEAPEADPDLPQPLDLSFADALVMNSPFTRTVDLAKTYQLTGVAYVDGRPIATVLNTETKQRMVVSEEPNASGLRLVAANAGGDLHETNVELQVGGETVSMHYDGQQMVPTGGVNGSAARLASSSKKDGGKVRTSSMLGDQGREMYASLSSEGRDKFKEIMKARLEKHPEMTPEQTSSYADKIISKIKAADQSSGGSSKLPKSSKPSKVKQGA